MHLPDGAGLGVDLDPAAVAKYLGPWQEVQRVTTMPDWLRQRAASTPERLAARLRRRPALLRRARYRRRHRRLSAAGEGRTRRTGSRAAFGQQHRVRRRRTRRRADSAPC